MRYDFWGRSLSSGFSLCRFAFCTHLVTVANTHAGERLLYRFTYGRYGCRCWLGRFSNLEFSLVLSGTHFTFFLSGGILLGLTEGVVTTDLRPQLIRHLSIERLLTEATAFGCGFCKLQGTLAGVGWRFVLQRHQIVVLHLSTNLFVCLYYGFSRGCSRINIFLRQISNPLLHRISFLGRGLTLGQHIAEQVGLLGHESFFSGGTAVRALHASHTGK